MKKFKLQPYEIISLVFTFLLVAGTALFLIYQNGIFCPMCKADFAADETYLWDVRTGTALPLSNYLDGHSHVLRLDRAKSLFLYCPRHAPDRWGSPFLLINAYSNCTITRPIPQNGSVLTGGHKIGCAYSEVLHDWEVTVLWQGPSGLFSGFPIN